VWTFAVVVLDVCVEDTFELVSPARLRACWVTQPPVGFAVQPARWTRRLPTSRTARRGGGA
jgi:hypothetical protein